MRRAVTAILRLMMRLFFRRIEIAGLDNVPADVPVIFAANHPNGLVDPLFILCFAPRPVSFLAKAPLFRYPLIGSFVRALDSIPVYRKQDNVTGSNDETFARAHDVLQHGGSIAIFPEGTTHSDPQLRELKTGAARIALGSHVEQLLVVPVGIYYTAKQTFRSAALVWFGEGFNPSRQSDVRELTAEIENRLDSVTLQADSRAALELIGRAEQIFSAGGARHVQTEFEIRRRFVDGYHYLREHDPARLERLSSAVRQYESELGGARLDPGDLTPRIEPRSLLRVLALLPVAIIGIVTHIAPYAIVDFFAQRFSHDEDEMTATIKFIAALLLYPLTWIAIAAIVWHFVSDVAGLIVLLILPFVGYGALQFVEQFDDFLGNMRALVYRTRARAAHERLVAQRQAIRDEILAIGDAMGVSV